MKIRGTGFFILMAMVFLFTITVFPAAAAMGATTYTVHDPQSWDSNEIATLKFSVRIDPCDLGQHAAIVKLPSNIVLGPAGTTITLLTSGYDVDAVNFTDNSFKLEINNPVLQKVEFLVTMQAQLQDFRGIITADMIGLYGDFTDGIIGGQRGFSDRSEAGSGVIPVPTDKARDKDTDDIDNGETAKGDTTKSTDKASDKDIADIADGETTKEDAAKPADITTRQTAVFTLGSGSYTVNGVRQTMDVAALAQDGRTYLPIRYAALALGVHESDILWHGASGTVTLIKDDNMVKLQVDSKMMTINNTQVDLDAGSITKGGRVFLPFRSIAAAFGATVVYDAVNQTVTMNLDQPS